MAAIDKDTRLIMAILFVGSCCGLNVFFYGIYGGVVTPTEAAAVAATYALLLAGFFYRALKISTLYEIFVRSARSSATI